MFIHNTLINVNLYNLKCFNALTLIYAPKVSSFLFHVSYFITNAIE